VRAELTGLRIIQDEIAIRRVDPTPRRRIIYPALAAAASVNLVAPFAKVLGGLLRARYVARDGQKTVGAFLGVVLFDQRHLGRAPDLGAIIAGPGRVPVLARGRPGGGRRSGGGSPGHAPGAGCAGAGAPPADSRKAGAISTAAPAWFEPDARLPPTGSCATDTALGLLVFLAAAGARCAFGPLGSRSSSCVTVA
jgi:hypothetical protein